MKPKQSDQLSRLDVGECIMQYKGHLNTHLLWTQENFILNLTEWWCLWISGDELCNCKTVTVKAEYYFDLQAWPSSNKYKAK